MSPMKSPSSSRRKGKTVASDSPAVPEEVEHSDSERSTEEETERDPDSECAPLIDPWYEINPHFLKVLGEWIDRGLKRPKEPKKRRGLAGQG